MIVRKKYLSPSTKFIPQYPSFNNCTGWEASLITTLRLFGAEANLEFSLVTFICAAKESFPCKVHAGTSSVLHR